MQRSVMNNLCMNERCCRGIKLAQHIYYIAYCNLSERNFLLACGKYLCIGHIVNREVQHPDLHGNGICRSCRDFAVRNPNLSSRINRHCRGSLLDVRRVEITVIYPLKFLEHAFNRFDRALAHIIPLLRKCSDSKCGSKRKRRTHCCYIHFFVQHNSKRIIL